MMGGIDQQVQQAQLSAGNDPQKLAQQYSESRDLIQLLAMQKLKSEKEAAAKEMQMQMQTQDKTIIEQREEELMGLTQQEVMAKLGPGMQQAGQASMPPQGMPPQGPPQGPPPNGFARGGIVSYAYGGDVSSDGATGASSITSANIEETLRKQIRAALAAGATVEQLRNHLKDRPQLQSIITEEAASNSTTPPAPEGIASIYQDDQMMGMPVGPEQGAPPPSAPEGIAALASPPPAAPPVATNTYTKDQPPANQDSGIPKRQGLEAIAAAKAAQKSPPMMEVLHGRANLPQQLGASAPPTPVDLKGRSFAGLDALKMEEDTANESLASLMAGDTTAPAAAPVAAPVEKSDLDKAIEAQQMALYKTNTEQLGIDKAAEGASSQDRYTAGTAGSRALADERAAERQRLEGTQAAASTPQKLMNEKLIAMLSGGAGSTTIGQSLGNSGIAAINTGNQQKDRQARESAAMQALMDSEYKDKYKDETGAISAYNTAEDRAQNAVSQASQTGATINATRERSETARIVSEDARKLRELQAGFSKDDKQWRTLDAIGKAYDKLNIDILENRQAMFPELRQLEKDYLESLTTSSLFSTDASNKKASAAMLATINGMKEKADEVFEERANSLREQLNKMNTALDLPLVQQTASSKADGLTYKGSRAAS